MSQQGINVFADVMSKLQMAKYTLIRLGTMGGTDQASRNLDICLGQLCDLANEAVKNQFCLMTMPDPDWGRINKISQAVKDVVASHPIVDVPARQTIVIKQLYRHLTEAKPEDEVRQCINNHKLGVLNGDVGKVSTVLVVQGKVTRMTVIFNGANVVTYDNERDLKQLRLLGKATT